MSVGLKPEPAMGLKKLIYKYNVFRSKFMVTYKQFNLQRNLGESLNLYFFKNSSPNNQGQTEGYEYK